MKIPKYTSLTDWAHSLIIDFPRDNVPILNNENDWKSWGNILVQENSFSRSGAPGTTFYKHWRPWADAVFKTMVNFQ